MWGEGNGHLSKSYFLEPLVASYIERGAPKVAVSTTDGDKEPTFVGPPTLCQEGAPYTSSHLHPSLTTAP